MKAFILFAVMMIGTGHLVQAEVLKCKAQSIDSEDFMDSNKSGTVLFDQVTRQASWQATDSSTSVLLYGLNRLCGFDIEHSGCQSRVRQNSKSRLETLTWCSMGGNADGADKGGIGYSPITKVGGVVCDSFRNGAVANYHIRFSKCVPATNGEVIR